MNSIAIRTSPLVGGIVRGSLIPSLTPGPACWGGAHGERTTAPTPVSGAATATTAVATAQTAAGRASVTDVDCWTPFVSAKDTSAADPVYPGVRPVAGVRVTDASDVSKYAVEWTGYVAKIQRVDE
jgi:hypothetical protein